MGDTVQSVTSAYVAEFDREVSDLEIQHLGYDRGEIVYVWHEDTDIVPTNYYDILAVYEDGTEVSQTVLYINVKLKSYEDMISVYGLNEEKVKIAGQIKNDLMSN